MNTTGLRERKKIRRREAIVWAAMQLFAERGYDETTIADIAEMADVAPRTVLTYFATKEEIAMAPVVEIAERLVISIRARAEGETSLDVFAVWLRGELFNAEAAPSKVDLLRRMFERNPKLTVLQATSTADAAAEVARAIAEDMGCAPDDVAPGLVVAAMSGIMTHILSGPIVGDREEAVDVAFSFLTAGVERLRSERAGW